MSAPSHFLKEPLMLSKRLCLVPRLSVAFLVFGALSVCGQQVKDLDARLRTLEKDIAGVRGLAFKKPVEAQIIGRPADAAKSIQGYYSIKDKKLFLYDDIKDSYQQGV